MTEEEFGQDLRGVAGARDCATGEVDTYSS